MSPDATARLSAAITVALGVAAILLPYFFTTLAVMMLAAVMFASGVVALFHAHAARRAGLQAGVFGPWAQVVVGIVLLLWPDVALWLVAMLLGGGLLVNGVLGLLALRESAVVNPPLIERLEPWISIALGVLLILMGAAGSALLLGIVLGVALIGSGLRQWRAADARG
ncbi:MAG: DUF308 domain-containing protein [Gammaproteobacteria bacterium]|nr:DUF308 domain-containing protein [Gammaproteobacteria bacterium]